MLVGFLRIDRITANLNDQTSEECLADKIVAEAVWEAR